MEVIAKSDYVRISPRKIYLVAAAVSGLKVNEAVEILQNLDKRAAGPLLLTLKQGIGNAVNNFKLEKETLLVKKIETGKGPTYKRGRPVARGRWHRILKRTSQITIILEGKAASTKKEAAKKHGTKG